MFQWIGPKRISGVTKGDLVYDVTSLVDGKTEQVHDQPNPIISSRFGRKNDQ